MKLNSNSIRKLIFVHLLAVMIFVFLWSVFGLPWELIYIFDALVCLEFAWIARSLQSVLRRTKSVHILVYLAVFVLYLILTQISNFVMPWLAFQAFRKTFRFYLFFFVCAVMLTDKWIDKIMKMMLIMQIPNLLISLYQYFIQGLNQDNLGGIFGIEKGVNAYSNVFLCLICTYIIVRYLDKQIKLLPMLMTIASSLLIAVLAELKVFFIEIVVLTLLAVLFSHPSARTVKTIGFSLAGFAAALALLGIVFPEHMAILLSFALLAQYTTGAIHGYNISRLNAFPEINKIFFKGNVFRNLFGYGFGNCDSGSAFYEKFQDYHYTWFSHQLMFLETGYVGIIFSVVFFIIVFAYATKSKKRNPQNEVYYTFTQITSILCVIWMVYNQTLHCEAAYLVFFVLAIPIAVRNQWIKEQKGNCENTVKY